MKTLDNIADRLQPDGECLVWTGALNNGVPRMRPGKTNPQRLIWQEYWELRLIPQIHIAPICGNRLCCNPQHLMMGKHAKPRSKPLEAPPPAIVSVQDDDLEECIGCIYLTDGWSMMSFDELCTELAPDNFTPDQIRAALAEIEDS